MIPISFFLFNHSCLSALEHFHVDNSLSDSIFHFCFPISNREEQLGHSNLSHSSKTREIHSSRLITALRKPPNLRSLFIGVWTDYHKKNPFKHDAATWGHTYNLCDVEQISADTPHIDTSGQITWGYIIEIQCVLPKLEHCSLYDLQAIQKTVCGPDKTPAHG